MAGCAPFFGPRSEREACGFRRAGAHKNLRRPAESVLGKRGRSAREACQRVRALCVDDSHFCEPSRSRRQEMQRGRGEMQEEGA